ncbi:hypothetical protein VUR80DRAFT_693 [Thermomyces stellatus]
MDVDSETKSVGSNSSAHAEAEVIRLANIILFPDQAMVGFPYLRPGERGGREGLHESHVGVFPPSRCHPVVYTQTTKARGGSRMGRPAR